VSDATRQGGLRAALTRGRIFSAPGRTPIPGAPEDPSRPEAIRAVPIRRWGRGIAAVVIGIFFVLLVVSLARNPNADWGTVAEYMFKGLVIRGVGVTVEFTLIAMLIGVVGGTVLAVMRLSSNWVLRGVSWIYIWFFRGTPLLVQILIWGNFALLYPRFFLGVPFTHYGLASIDSNTLLPVFMAAILALGLNEAAYAAELVRAGIISVDKGQSEAGESLGMSSLQIMRRIILPQAMRVIIPPMGNETISMLKSTALISVISGHELMTNITIVYSQNLREMPLLFVASIWYIFLTTLLTIAQYYIERHFGKGFGDKETESAEKRALKRLQSKGGDLYEPGNF
jgi:polar amino acid transport system permease protein